MDITRRALVTPPSPPAVRMANWSTRTLERIAGAIAGATGAGRDARSTETVHRGSWWIREILRGTPSHPRRADPTRSSGR